MICYFQKKLRSILELKKMNINYKDYINDIPDFPIDGILYRDIQPLLGDNRAIQISNKDMGKLVDIPDYWVGIESRGFLFICTCTPIWWWN